MQALFQGKLQVLNVGLSSFAESIASAGGTVLAVEWAPPAQGRQSVCRDLSKLVNLPAVEAANEKAFDSYLSAQPVLRGIGVAGKVLPNMADRMILHGGPPISWEDMCGPMKGAIIGAILYEGWAKDTAGADALASGGEIVFEPCHHHAAVGPMAGVISPSMPVWMVVDATHDNQAFSNFNEGIGRALRFGANGPEVIDRLKWIEQVLAPTLRAGVETLGGLDLKTLMAQALHMGDEVHNRNVAASSLFLKRLISALLKTATPSADIAAAVDFIASNDHFFLNLSMTACKAMLDAAHGVRGSSMVTAMARNGVEFGIRVSGAGDQWFTTRAPVVDGLFFPGYTKADAAPDLGDSAITESAGVGGFAMAASPAIVKFVGGSPQDAIDNTTAMTYITLGRNGAFTLPAMNFAGSPAGIDIRKVVDTGIQPIINTGIAHREAGVGQIGAGITRAPLDCFTQAVSALARALCGSHVNLEDVPGESH
ncbi:MAG: oxamate carbamoyltransferase subunit AllG family protein [Nitrospiraceae bacterium]